MIIEAIYKILSETNAEYTLEEIRKALELSPAEMDEALTRLVKDQRAFVLANGAHISDRTATRLIDTARRVLTAYHRKNPYKNTMSIVDLNASLTRAATMKDFTIIADFLQVQGIAVRAEDGIRLPEHQVTLPEPWLQPAEEILAVYQAARFDPPMPGNFQANYPRDINVMAILKILSEIKKLVELTDQIYISYEAFEEAFACVKQLAGTPEGVTIATLRDATQSTRKISTPLLEYMDAKGLTRRIGDKRLPV
jgi:selenocysteine-specific elongation factor